MSKEGKGFPGRFRDNASGGSEGWIMFEGSVKEDTGGSDSFVLFEGSGFHDHY